MTRIRDATPSDAAALARVQLDSWRVSFAGLMPAAYLADFSYAEQEEDWREILAAAGDVLVVAEEPEGDVVGYAWGGPQPGESSQQGSELYAMHVLAERHGEGLGRGLLAAAAERLRGRGHRGLMLWVMAANPARGFYEHLGGRELARRQVTIGREAAGAFAIDEVAYGWDDIGALCAT